MMRTTANTALLVSLLFAAEAAAAPKPATKPQQQFAALVQQAAGQLKAGQLAEARQTLDRCAKLEGIGAAERFEAKALAAGVTGVKSAAAMREELGRAVAADKASAAVQAGAYERGAKLFNETRQYAVVRQFLAMGEQLLAPGPRNVYRCRYLADPPVGVAGWALSKLLDDPNYREARFGPYDKAHAEKLVTDVSGQRGTQEGGGSDEQRGTAFYMVYDARGWHIFVLSREPDIEDITDAGGSGGALEMAFSPPSEGACYHQWIADLAGNDVSVYDWDSPHRHFRSLKGEIRCDTVGLKDAYGTYIFIPWTCLHDKLPLDGGKWPFSVIRWKKGGGVTWGGKVHEIGRWGLVDWQPPTPAQKLAMQTGIVKRAWGKYAKTRAAQTRYWQDPEVGDPAFYKEALAPAIERLDEYGRPLESKDKLTAEVVARLFKEAVPHWMEFDYDVSELRAEYLRKQLLSP